MIDNPWLELARVLRDKGVDALGSNGHHGMAGARYDAYHDAADMIESIAETRPPTGWWFCPLYGKDSVGGPPDIIDAETLDDAFRRARMMWPTAIGWKCLGATDPKDRERATNKDNGITERVVRRRKP